MRGVGQRDSLVGRCVLLVVRGVGCAEGTNGVVPGIAFPVGRKVVLPEVVGAFRDGGTEVFKKVIVVLMFLTG